MITWTLRGIGPENVWFTSDDGGGFDMPRPVWDAMGQPEIIDAKDKTHGPH